MTRLRRLLLISCILFILPGFALGAQAPIIERIVIHGLKTVEEPFIRLSIQCRRGKPFEEALLLADLAKLRSTGLFSSAKHEVEELSPGRVRLELTFSESPVIKEVAVRGSVLVDEKCILELAGPLRGQTPSPENLAKLRSDIDALYLKAGYFACGVSDTSGLHLDDSGILQIIVQEPVLGTISLAGLQRVRSIDVRRRLILEKGKPLSVERMKNSVRRLGKLGTLRSAIFAVENRSKDGHTVNLVLRMVEEKQTGELAYGMRYTTVDRSFATLELTKRNIMSTGKTLTLESELGGRTTYLGKISTDWFLGDPISAEASLFRQKYNRQIREENAITSTFNERRRGQGFTLRKILPKGLRLQVGLRNEKVSATASDDFTLPTNLASIGGNPITAHYEQSSLRLSAARGPYLLPLDDAHKRASYLDLDYVGGPLQGPADFFRLRGGKRVLVPRGKRNRLALRIEVGRIHLNNGILPLLESLTLGGSETLRGFNYKEFTGNRLILSNLEFRRRLSPRLESVAFMDWGDCWPDGERSFDGKLGYGLGLRIDLSIFRLRIDAAHGVGRNGTQFTFGVGHLF